MPALVWIVVVALSLWPVAMRVGRAITRRLPDPALPALVATPATLGARAGAAFWLTWSRDRAQQAVTEAQAQLRAIDQLLTRPAVPVAPRRTKGGR